ncbi:hypothetical protein AK812_SmicGene9746, partial [Symbiodinium microadriaticum]
MPLLAWRTWKDRITEIHEYGVWLEAFTSWVSVLHSSFGPEIQEAVTREAMASPLTHEIMTVEQIQRSQRVLHLLKQAFAGFGRVESIAGLLESVGGMQKASGYELLRRITEEFSLQSRNEALHYRNQLLSYQVHGTNLLETVWLVEVAVNKYHRMLGASMPDLRHAAENCWDAKPGKGKGKKGKEGKGKSKKGLARQELEKICKQTLSLQKTSGENKGKGKKGKKGKQRSLTQEDKES